MRVMLMWPGKEPEVKILLDELTNAGHTIVYWVGENAVARLAPKDCIFQDHYDAWDGRPARGLDELTLPPSGDLIKKFADSESLILSIMNKHFDKASVDERKQMYYDMLGYWDQVFRSLKPDAVLFSTYPHSIYTNIIYELAHMRAIPTWCSEYTWVAGRLLWYRDIWKGSDELRAAIKRLTEKRVSPEDLGDEMREYWTMHTDKGSKVAPPYFLLEQKKATKWGMFRHRVTIARRLLFSRRLFSLSWGYLKRAAGENLKKEHARVVRTVDWGTPFVYFPLQFQPECTTNPQGGVFHQQILVAEILSAALPEGWELYIKEHPGQWWSRGKERFSSARYSGYYARMARIPRVRLVPVSTDTFELTEKAQAVAVITGTAGWEALLRGKCPLVFGFPWWRDCPGALRVDSIETCKEAFEKIRSGAHTTQDTMLAYLKALEEASIRAFVANPLEKKPLYTPVENMKTIARYVREQLLDKV